MGEAIGKLFGPVTKTGVQQPSGPNGQPGTTTYYPTAEDATIAASRQLPSADAILNANGGTILNPNTVAPPMPTVTQPNFADANANGGPFYSPALTSKGRALGLLLTGLEGAAAGAAAGAVKDPRISPGVGPSAAAGFNVPFVQAQQRNQLAQEDLDRQREQAQIAGIPGQQAAERAHLAAETNLANAGAARKDNYVIPNVGLVDSGGNVVVPEPSLGAKSQADIDVKKKEAATAGLDPEQTLQYVYGIKPTPTQGVDQQELTDWMAKNPGKGPSDFMKYKATIAPAFNFSLQQNGAGSGTNFPAGTSIDDKYKSFGSKAGVIRGIVEGRQSPPSAFAQKTPYWQDVMEKVYAVDPQWNEQTAQLRKSYSSGRQSAEINAINTAMGHVGVLGDSIAALNNGDVKLLNSIANQLGVQVGQTPVTTFNTIIHRVGPELSKAYIGAGGSAGERGADEKDFDPSLGPQQLAANVAITSRLLQSKIGSLENQWNQNAAPGMKSFRDQFITPEAQAALNKYSGGAGIQVTAPDGSVHTFPDQASAAKFRQMAGIQ